MFNSQTPAPGDLPSSAQLAKSTIIAAAAAAVILVTIVLPSEYAIDPTGIGSAMGLTAMGEIKTQLAEEAEADRLKRESTQPAPQQGSGLMDRLVREFGISSAHAQESRKDEMTITLQPGGGAEIKLAMLKGAIANYAWKVNGGSVNFDTHGDGGGQNISYEKGRSISEDSGVLKAAFDGNHGWFWRNRTSAPLTLTLTTDGVYSDIKQMM